MAFTAIAGGLAAAGALGGLLGGRPDRLSRSDVNPDPEGRALARYRELRDPTYMFEQFRRLGQEASGTADQFLQSAAAMGGSERLARARQQESRSRRAKEAIDRFRQFRVGAEGMANQALQMNFQNERFITDQINRRTAQRAQATQSFFDNVAGIGGTLLGAQLGGGQSTNASPLAALRRQYNRTRRTFAPSLTPEARRDLGY